MKQVFLMHKPGGSNGRLFWTSRKVTLRYKESFLQLLEGICQAVVREPVVWLFCFTLIHVLLYLTSCSVTGYNFHSRRLERASSTRLPELDTLISDTCCLHFVCVCSVLHRWKYTRRSRLSDSIKGLVHTLRDLNSHGPIIAQARNIFSDKVENSI